MVESVPCARIPSLRADRGPGEVDDRVRLLEELRPRSAGDVGVPPTRVIPGPQCPDRARVARDERSRHHADIVSLFGVHLGEWTTKNPCRPNDDGIVPICEAACRLGKVPHDVVLTKQGAYGFCTIMMPPSQHSPVIVLMHAIFCAPQPVVADARAVGAGRDVSGSAQRPSTACRDPACPGGRGWPTAISAWRACSRGIPTDPRLLIQNDLGSSATPRSANRRRPAEGPHVVSRRRRCEFRCPVWREHEQRRVVRSLGQVLRFP